MQYLKGKVKLQLSGGETNKDAIICCKLTSRLGDEGIGIDSDIVILDGK
jgi:hypothetical protein